MKTIFAARMAELRQEKKLNQREAAAHLGISQALLSHYENGAREPKFEFVLDACKYYCVTSDYLLGRSDERKPEAIVLSEKIRDIIEVIEELRDTETALIDELIDLLEQEI